MSSSFWDEDQVVGDFGRCYYLHGAERRLCQSYFPEGGLILDLGCGAGRTTLPLHEAGYRVVGVDLSFRMVSHMKRRFPYLRAVAANAAALPFVDDMFDGVLFSYNGLDLVYPMGDRANAISEIRRVLRPGGSFVFSAHNTVGIVLNLRDRGLRTIPERLFAMRALSSVGYVYEKALRSHVYYCGVQYLISELDREGFQWERTYERNGRFGAGFARWFDPWPSHCFRKR